MIRLTVAPLLIAGVTMGALGFGEPTPAPAAGQAALPLQVFLDAASTDARTAERAFAELARTWTPGDAALLVDLARFLRSAANRTQDPSAVLATHARLIGFLERQTGQRFGDDLDHWRRWLWALPYAPPPQFLAFKAALYGAIDPRMTAFFTNRSTIRLDQVEWGGVAVNGIPPLTNAKHVPAAEASWLRDSHIVFGVAIGGEARAYPRRILAWHEMAHDRLGGVDLTIVYCTLCGTVIPYESVVDGVKRTFGTSGLLYRSNKLMFDEESKSLWSTLEGAPVIGPLAGSPARLRARPVVTTTWAEWRHVHPDTTVLSIDTGFSRDYAEGVAYRDYFATDRLMFQVPDPDPRLKNKDEVLAMLVPAVGGGRQAVAIDVSFLARHPVFLATFEGQPLVVVTTPAGGNRVYDAGARRFVSIRRDGALIDDAGRAWAVTEEALVLAGAAPERLARRTAFRAFWFGWHAQFPDSDLIK